MTNSEFAILIHKAIGPIRSRNQFAKDAGISPGTLSMLLNHEHIIPRITTLRKIADASDGRVSLQELQNAAFGYTGSPELDRSLYKALLTTLDTCRNSGLYANVSDFLEEVVSRAPCSLDGFVFLNTRRYRGKEYRLAEFCVDAVFLAGSSHHLHKYKFCAFRLYFTQTASDKIMIIGFSGLP